MSMFNAIETYFKNLYEALDTRLRVLEDRLRPTPQEPVVQEVTILKEDTAPGTMPAMFSAPARAEPVVQEPVEQEPVEQEAVTPIP